MLCERCGYIELRIDGKYGYQVVVVSVSVGCCGQVGGALPGVVDKVLELKLTAGNVDECHVMLAVLTHGGFELPVIPGARDEDVSAAKAPVKHGWHEVVIAGLLLWLSVGGGGGVQRGRMRNDVVCVAAACVEGRG